MNLNYLKGTATFKIIILNIICFVLTAAGTLFAGTFANNYYLTVGQFQLYRLVTSMFYHYGFLHILCNMMSLSNIGVSVEQRFGKKNFYVIYFVTGIVGGLIACIIHKMLGNNVLSGGASGAIFGLLGCLIWSMNGDFNDKLRVLFQTIWPVLIISVLGSGIDNVCHLTCLLIGILMSFIYKKKF